MRATTCWFTALSSATRMRSGALRRIGRRAARGRRREGAGPARAGRGEHLGQRVAAAGGVHRLGQAAAMPASRAAAAARLPTGGSITSEMPASRAVGRIARGEREPVHAGHLHVEQHRRRRAVRHGGRRRERSSAAAPVGRFVDDAPPGAELLAGARLATVVVDHEHPRPRNVAAACGTPMPRGSADRRAATVNQNVLPRARLARRRRSARP